MNKDFEKAYKELAKTEVPDLWDRIEAGISEKSTPDAGEKILQNVTEKSIQERKLPLLLFVKRYSTLAAAVLCAVILIPTIIVMKKAGSKSFSEGTANMAFPSMETEEAEEAAGEAAPESVMADEAASESMMADEAASESMMANEATKEAATENIAKGDMQKKETAGAVKEEAEVKQESAMEDEASAVTEEKNRLADVFSANVTISVETAEDWIGESSDETGTLYTVMVIDDPSGRFSPEQKIEIFLPAYSSIALIEGDTYELGICPFKGDVYTVAEFGRQPDE